MMNHEEWIPGRYNILGLRIMKHKYYTLNNRNRRNNTLQKFGDVIHSYFGYKIVVFQ
jgi:hypothetical protein